MCVCVCAGGGGCGGGGGGGQGGEGGGGVVDVYVKRNASNIARKYVVADLKNR